MPTCEYGCESCGSGFELGQGIHDPAVTTCPKCGKRVERLISGGAGFIVKAGYRPPGSGFESCRREFLGETCCGREERCSKPPCR
ncbi:MAG: zinc ribbon domain-containing protein [candidate division WOR-3 bacterium]